MDIIILMTAIIVWNPGGAKGARGDTSVDTLRVWADSIVAVCQSRRECLMMAEIASEETHFAPWVLDGSCQRQGWRALHVRDHYHACDKGHSYGPWQIFDKTWAKVNPIGPEGVGPNEHAATALYLLRTNPHGWMTYDAAAKKVDAWMAAHP